MRTAPPHSNQMPRPVAGRFAARVSASEAGFGIIEVLVALMIIAIAMSAGLTAIAGARNIKERSDVRAYMTELAQQKFEDLRTDNEFLISCDNAWRTQSTGSWKWCNDQLQDVTVTNRDGRVFHVVRKIVPKDDNADDTGDPDPIKASQNVAGASGDADAKVRDYYEVSINVSIDKGSMSGIGKISDAPRFKSELNGRMDLTIPSHGKVYFAACAVNRKDRRFDTTNCKPNTNSENPAIPGVQIRLINTRNVSQSYMVAALTDSQGRASTSLPSGDYKVVADPVTGVGIWNGATFYRSSPPVVHVVDSGVARADITMIKPDGTTSVCVRMAAVTPAGPGGHYVDETNIMWGDTTFIDAGSGNAKAYAPGADVFRTKRLGKITDSWNCDFKLSDPQGYTNDAGGTPRMFVGQYEVAVGQHLGIMPSGATGLRIERLFEPDPSSPYVCGAVGSYINNGKADQPWDAIPANLANKYGPQDILQQHFDAIDAHTSPSYDVRNYLGQEAGGALAAYRFTYDQRPGDQKLCIEFRGAPAPLNGPPPPPTPPYDPCPGGVPTTTANFAADPIGTNASRIRLWLGGNRQTSLYPKNGVGVISGKTGPWQFWSTRSPQLLNSQPHPSNCAIAPGSTDPANKFDPFLSAGILNSNECQTPSKCEFEPQDVNFDGTTDYACMLVQSPITGKEQFVKIIGKDNSQPSNLKHRYFTRLLPTPLYESRFAFKKRANIALTPGAAHSLWGGWSWGFLDYDANNRFEMKLDMEFVGWYPLGQSCRYVNPPPVTGGSENLPVFPFDGNFSNAIRETA